MIFSFCGGELLLLLLLLLLLSDGDECDVLKDEELADATIVVAWTDSASVTGSSSLASDRSDEEEEEDAESTCGVKLVGGATTNSIGRDSII